MSFIRTIGANIYVSERLTIRNDVSGCFPPSALPTERIQNNQTLTLWEVGGKHSLAHKKRRPQPMPLCCSTYKSPVVLRLLFFYYSMFSHHTKSLGRCPNISGQRATCDILMDLPSSLHLHRSNFLLLRDLYISTMEHNPKHSISTTCGRILTNI